ncbi:hypothetical protein QJS10_CPA01g00599 [Acorus calamus]|uniref:Uncharacterized protein n=1 Tax=Acorus calamus TaxID=4465 RepID=A0AAV9FIE3_ACOCL|nr:hypothetical protein QJS10_CPA01g00599 [Acorus calamus]
MPFIAVATVAILCGSAIAQNASAILTSGLQVVLSCCALHASAGFFFGYVLSRTMGIDVSSSRTISIEVGMQHGIRTEVTIPKHGGIMESNAANHEAWSITYSLSSEEDHATRGLVEYLVIQEQVLIQSASLLHGELMRGHPPLHVSLGRSFGGCKKRSG